jgi:hypothetical protein
MVTMPAELAQAVEDFRFQNRITTEAEAIRRLIEAGLKAKTASSGGTGSGGSGKPAKPSKPAAPRARKPAQDRMTSQATPTSKEAQLRALREQGAR